MDRIEIVGAALVGSYLGWVVVTALRRGTIRYRGRIHSRVEAPKDYWPVVAWFGVLGLICLAYAAVRAMEVLH